METKHSRIGIASFVLSLVAGLSMLLLIAIAGILRAKNPGGSQETNIVIGMVAIALFFLDLLAAALGIATLFQKEQKKLFGILGLSFSCLVVVIMGALMLIGLLMKGLH